MMRAATRPKKGYWGRASASTALNIEGLRPADKSVALGGGWNLVGVVGPSAAQPTQPVQPYPPVQSIWWYEPPYRTPDTTCVEGWGYWIRVSEPTTIWRSD